LDAATSLGLVVSMRALAQSGHTVVSTIHQPSSAMFLMFDRVILLAEGGWTVYSGPTKDVLSYFASLGLHTPGPQYNAADFMRRPPLHSSSVVSFCFGFAFADTAVLALQSRW
jgi:ABC-type multidrug transport system ATPase subunit